MKKQTKMACLILAFAAILSSCKKNEQPTIAPTTAKSSLNAGHPVYDLLGYGYDVTGRFADSESSRMQVLDIQKFVSMEPASLPVNSDVSTEYDYYFGDNASTYSEGLSQKYNATFGLKAFTGEVKSSFKDSSSISSKNVYAGASMFIKQRRWKLYSTAANLRDNYLSANFLSDVASMPAALLVQRYGTHVLTDITLGAKFNVTYKSATNNSNRINSAKVGLKFNGLFKMVGFDGTYETNETETRSNYNQELYYNSFGGDGSKGLVGDVKLDNSPLTLSIGTWQSTCNANNAVLIKIGENGFVPLDELISNPAKSAEVKAYVTQYLIDHKLKITGQEVYEFASPILNKHANSLDPNLGLGSNEGWRPNGQPFKAYSYAYNGAVPVYQFIKRSNSDRLLSTNRNFTYSGYVYDGIIFYAYTSQVAGTVPIYQYAQINGVPDHLYDPNPAHGFPGWMVDGVAFWALPN